MSVIRGQLTESATVYTISTATSTGSRQPIETLVNTGLVYKCKFKPKRSFFYYLTGQVDLTDDIIVTEREIVLNNVLEIDTIKYRIVKVSTLRSQGARARAVVGYAGKVEIFRH